MFAKPLLKTTLAFAAACTLWAGSAQATVHTISLFGSVGSGFSQTVFAGPSRFDFFTLSLSGLEGLNAIDVVQGDTIDATVTLDTLLNVPASVDRTGFFLSLQGDNFPGGDTGVTGPMSFFNGMDLVFALPSGLTTSTEQLIVSGNLFPPDNVALSFDSFTTSFTVDTLSGPWTLGRAVAGYLLVSPGMAAVPEPATWAMMIIGFGGVGALMRRRRRDSGGLAAFA